MQVRFCSAVGEMRSGLSRLGKGLCFFMIGLALFQLPAAVAGTDSELPPIVFAAASGNDTLPEMGRPARSAVGYDAARQTQKRTRALMAAGVGAVALYGATVWWKEGVSGTFRTTNEGWFGQDTYTGGADKLGHAFATYAGTRLLTRGFEWAGNGADDSLRLAALTALGTLTAVEVMDGFSERYRFSPQDAVVNIAGVGLGVLLEKNPELDRLLDFRLRYWPSADARRLNEVDPIGDHSGQTYLLIVKAAGVPALRKHEELRYFELALGYGSRGYEPNDGTPSPDRSRHAYFGVSLNLSEILAATVFRGNAVPSRAQRVTDGVLEFVQIPGTVALADHRL